MNWLRRINRDYAPIDTKVAFCYFGSGGFWLITVGAMLRFAFHDAWDLLFLAVACWILSFGLALLGGHFWRRR